jgi:hypothetical protein
LKRTAVIAAAIFLAAGTALAGETPAPEGARLYFIAPLDGATVSSPVTVVFGLKGMGVAPAGVEKEMTGHHHLLIDTDELSGAALNEPIPADDHHRHFGGGQTETTIELAPGTVVSPRGNFLVEASEDKDELVTADMDMDKVREVRNLWQFFRDRRPEAYGPLTQA